MSIASRTTPLLAALGLACSSPANTPAAPGSAPAADARVVLPPGEARAAASSDGGEVGAAAAVGRPERCPPIAAGSPPASPQLQTLALGPRSLQLALCPSGSSSAPTGLDVVWMELDGGELRIRLIPDDNWTGGASGMDSPQVGAARAEVLGPFATGSHAVVLRRHDEGWGRGEHQVWVVDAEGVLGVMRAFPGGGSVGVDRGQLIGTEGDESEAAYQVAALDRVWRWTPAGWVEDGPRRLRTDLDRWPCEREAVAIVDPSTGAPTGETLVVETDDPLRALEVREAVGRAPAFLIQVGETAAWVRQIEQRCAG